MHDIELKNGLEAVGKAAGAEAYDYLSDDDKAVVAFGMVPVTSIEPFENQMRPVMIDQIKTSLSTKYGIDKNNIGDEGDETKLMSITKGTVKKWMSALSRGFTSGIMKAASDAGKLVV